MSGRWMLITSLILLLTSTVPSHAAAPIDSTLFTNYTLEGQAKFAINWVVCGSTQQTSGCYGSGSMGYFGKVGAMIEGNPATDLTKGTVTRYIYVLDVAYGSKSNEVALYVYKKVDTITTAADTVSVTLFKTVVLPLTGGSATVASMAANQTFLYVGTNNDELAVQVKKSNFAMSQFSGGSGTLTVSAITANSRGFVTVTWGTKTGPGTFYVLDPTGRAQSDGGGASFMVNTYQAFIPSTLP